MGAAAAAAADDHSFGGGRRRSERRRLGFRRRTRAPRRGNGSFSLSRLSSSSSRPLLPWSDISSSLFECDECVPSSHRARREGQREEIGAQRRQLTVSGMGRGEGGGRHSDGVAGRAGGGHRVAEGRSVFHLLPSSVFDFL
mmetsp:Transcript_29995/g.63627  ORF Transcript_29995/g.63627 Transcript_29995/m.63627 type:complete len:141 (-) Transcript_29995:381-803(-)